LETDRRREEAAMKDTDKVLRDAVLKALELDVKIDPAHVGVVVNDGAVTLIGFVRSPVQKRAAVRAVGGVPGVAAVADDLEVRPPGGPVRSDSEIAEDIARWRRWAMVPPTVHADVRDGHVTLRGDVDADEQRRDAERVFAKVHGVRTVTNRIGVLPHRAPDPREVERRADDAIRTLADVDGRSIHATVEGGTVRLTGTVNSEAESLAAERAAASAPGVTAVANEIVVTP
jgi:osmotically-inducible protein OsmY